MNILESQTLAMCACGPQGAPSEGLHLARGADPVFRLHAAAVAAARMPCRAWWFAVIIQESAARFQWSPMDFSA